MILIMAQNLELQSHLIESLLTLEIELIQKETNLLMDYIENEMM